MKERKNKTEKISTTKTSRRNFLKVAGAAAGAVAVAATVSSVPFLKSAQAAAANNPNKTTTAIVPLAFYQSTGLSKFAQPMRGVDPATGIPVAVPDSTTGGVDHYKIDIEEYHDTLHPNLGPTRLRGYHPQNALGGVTQQRHLGGIIIANQGTPVQITFTNKLTGTHPIPIDRTLMGANDGDNRADVHLHGGFVPWISDGGPFTWFGPQINPYAVNYGPSARTLTGNVFQVVNPAIGNGQAEYYYPNNQSARMVWYHDHTVGITRMNAYIGIASAYLVRDTYETGTLMPKGLPDYIELGGKEIPIVIQDKIFVDSETIGTTDPTWKTAGGDTSTGSLWYAHTYDPKRYKLTGNKKGPGSPPDPSVVPEFFGDTMLANGLVYPVQAVEPRRYRLRILNACQARFLNLQLYVDDGTTDSITLAPITLAPTNDKGPDFLVIGTEGGFLPKPVQIQSNVPFNPSTLGGSLITAPAERFDVIVDFSSFAGQKLILYNDAPAPFPIGDPRNDYFPMAPNNPTITDPGFGPNTRQIMRFDVGSSLTTSPDTVPFTISPDTDLTAGNDPLPVALGSKAIPSGVPIRRLTLNESADGLGRLIQTLGTDDPPVNVGHGFGRAYIDPATEVITLSGGIKNEVWQIINLTGDTHPIHFHLVNVQIISRQTFHVSKYNGDGPAPTGLPRAPDLYEQGWKETVRMNPGEVTTVYMPFKLPTDLPFTVPTSLRTGGYEYVWHCHILEHEEHDMMRPLVVNNIESED